MIQSARLFNRVAQGKRKYSIVDGDLTNVKSACSSVVERCPDKTEVVSSILTTRILAGFGITHP